MNKSRLIAYAVAALLLLAAATRFSNQHFANQDLERENSSLRPKAALVEKFRDENTRLRASKPELAAAEALAKVREERRRDHAELEQLRQRRAELNRQEEEDVEKVRREIEADRARFARQDPPGDPNVWRNIPITGSISITAARNKGTATPEDLLETWLWAVEHGKGELLRELRLPPDSPPEFKDQLRPETLLVMDETHLSDVTDVVLKEKIAKGKGDAEVRFELELKRDREPNPREWVGISLGLRRFVSEWRITNMGGTSATSK